MKAAILVKNKAPLVVADIELPRNLDYGQVLVRVKYSGVCGAQINEINAVKGEDKFLPHLLGHEGGAIVEKTGPGVAKVKPGDHAVLHWMKGEGIQSATPKYDWYGKTVNAGWVTTFNEYAVVSENRVTKIPESYSLKTAALYGCALTTAYGVIHNDAGLKAGESVIIYGAGGVGQAIIMMAKLISAYPIIAVDILDSKLSAARKIGATHTINIKESDFRNKLSQAIGNDLADVTIDTTGRKEIRELAYETAGAQGRTIFVGVPPHGEKISIDSFQLHFGKVVTGSHGGDCHPDIDIPRLVRLHQAGLFSPDILISKVYPLEKINDAIEDLRHGKVIRCLVQM